MPSCEGSNERSTTDPIRDVRCVASPADPLLLIVTIELAEHVAQCCINPEGAFIELIGNGQHLKAHFSLRDHRPGYLMETAVKLPALGTYSYRVVSRILERTLTREGTYIAQ